MFKHEIETTVEIQGASDAVWGKLQDFAAYADWNPMIVQLDGEARPGNKLQFVVKQLDGKLLKLAARFKRIEPGKELRWAGGVPGVVHGEHYFVIESIGEGCCRFRHGEVFSGLLIPFLKSFLERKGRPLYQAMNNSLRDLVEKAGD